MGATNDAELFDIFKNHNWKEHLDTIIEKALLGKGGGIKYLFTIDKICLFIVSINLAVTTIFAIKGHTHFTYIITIMSLCFYLFSVTPS